MFNSRHRAKPLSRREPDTEVFVKDLKRSGKVVKAATTPRSYEVETPTCTVRRTRAHLTPIPDVQKQQRPTPAANSSPVKNKVAMPMQTDICDPKGHLQVPPVTPILATRPKRVIKPSLKVRENLGLE